jgi:hypothetical protein
VSFRRPAGLPPAQGTIAPTPFDFHIPSTFDAASFGGTGASATLATLGISSMAGGDWPTACSRVIASTTPATSFAIMC